MRWLPAPLCLRACLCGCVRMFVCVHVRVCVKE